MNDVLSVEEQQNVCGSKMSQGKKLVLCLPPPHSAGRTDVTFYFPSEADHDGNIVSENITEVMLFALAFLMCPSTESCCCIQHLVAMYY